jgi:hypothetical protein
MLTQRNGPVVHFGHKLLNKRHLQVWRSVHAFSVTLINVSAVIIRVLFSVDYWASDVLGGSIWTWLFIEAILSKKSLPVREERVVDPKDD